MASEASTSRGIPSRPTYACIRCSARKVKCDRRRPCQACVKHNVDCVFNSSPPVPKRHKRVKEQILTDRLRHYEALLQEQGIEPSTLPDTPDSEPKSRSSPSVAGALQTPSSIDSEPSGCVNKTQVVQGQGQSKFVDNSLWTRVIEEFHDPEDALEDSGHDGSDQEGSDDDIGYVLNNHARMNSRPIHPPAERMYQLWQIYIENIDPLTKILHVPTLRPAIQKAVSNIEILPRSFEALMFAIYAAAVMSLDDGECQQRFSEPRKNLLSRYISATKAALSRAQFMATTSLVVLQALVLHLLTVRDIYEPRAVWTLTGVAVRIAEGMGLERDGQYLGLPQFETEMRRRIWWQLKTHDFRTAELCGQQKFRDLDTGPERTKWPSNVNDDDLYPGMPSLLPESNPMTDMLFVAVRYELQNFVVGRIARFREQGKEPSNFNLHASGRDRAEIDTAFRETEEMLETKYLRHCDAAQPLHLLTNLMVRFAMNTIRFFTHHPRRWGSIEQTPPAERNFVWDVSLKLLEQQHMIQSNPSLKQFAWHATYSLQWYAFIHVLDTLRANPLIADAEKAWRLIGNTHKNNPDIGFKSKKPIHVAVSSLCLKAYTAREAALRNDNLWPPSTPECILQLRRQREAAKVKRQARGAKSVQSEHSAKPDLSSIDTFQSSDLRQSALSYTSGPTQNGGVPDGDPFWIINGSNDGGGGSWNDAINMDLDFMLDQDPVLQNDTTPTITWEQWDAWLSNSNVIRPLS